jgi:nitrogen fixation protein NifU and related proteins
MDSFYHDVIKNHFHKPVNYGLLVSPTHRATVANHACGDSVTVTAIIANDQLKKVGFEAVGCILSVAFASLALDHVLQHGLSQEYVKQLDEEFIKTLTTIDLGPIRTKCSLIGLLALQKSLE